MRRISSFIILIVALGSVYAQERPSFINVVCEQFTTDSHGDLYVWKESSLDKYSENSNQEYAPLHHYSNQRLGTISYVDASMPTKILVFYKEANSIVLLDNTLTSISQPLNLFDKEFKAISLVSHVGPSRMALYDESNMELFIVDYELNKISSTKCNFYGDFQPFLMLSRPNSNIILVDSTQGIYFFDYYGTFEKKLPITGITAAQLYYDNNEIIYLKDHTLYRFLPNQTPWAWKKVSDAKNFQQTLRGLYTVNPSGKIEYTPSTVD